MCVLQVSLRLDTSRNELLITNTSLAILACCFGMGAYISGIFGMNLDNTEELQHTKNVFYIVIVASVASMVLLFVTLILLLRWSGMYPKRLFLLRKDALKFQ